MSISFLLIFLICEASTRFYVKSKYKNHPFKQQDNQLSVTHMPFFACKLTSVDVKINSLGLRNKELSGKENDKAITINGMETEIVDLSEAKGPEALHSHTVNSNSSMHAYLLAQMTDHPDFPTPVGIFRKQEVACYEDELNHQVKTEMERWFTSSISIWMVIVMLEVPKQMTIKPQNSF